MIDLNFLNQIKRIYHFIMGFPFIGKDIFTTLIQTRMNHCVSALINHDMVEFCLYIYGLIVA